MAEDAVAVELSMTIPQDPARAREVWYMHAHEHTMARRSAAWPPCSHCIAVVAAGNQTPLPDRSAAVNRYRTELCPTGQALLNAGWEVTRGAIKQR